MSSKAWLKDGKLILGDDGKAVLCDECPCSVCADRASLKQLAEESGWTWHEQGRLYHLAEYGSTYGSWYDIDDGDTYLCCAEAPTCLYVIDCQCTGITTLTPPSGAPSGYYMYLDISGACTCYDDRQILLQNPTEFGVEEIVYGSHAKYTYSTGGSTYTSTVCPISSFSGMSQSFDLFLDYRTFCVIYKKYQNGSVMKKVRYISPAGSPVGSGVTGVFDTATFAGYLVPFAQDPDIDSGNGWWWCGVIYEWMAYYFGDPSEMTVCGLSLENAQAMAALDWSDSCGMYPHANYSSVPVDAPLSPDVSKTHHAGQYYEKDGAYCAYRGYYTMGEHRTRSGTDAYVSYRTQYIQTNKGILRYGNASYEQSFLAYGYNGSSGMASATCNMYCPPQYDTTITATLIDEDMHGCSSDDDWDWSESE